MDCIKKCRKCKQLKDHKDFNKLKQSEDGLQSLCKSCRSVEYFENKERVNRVNKEWYAKNKKKRNDKAKEHYRNNKEQYATRIIKRKRLIHNMQANNTELENSKIDKIYKNTPDGYDVDHIVPIKNENVCGLHKPHNLQYLKEEDNCKKRNFFDMKNPNKYDFTTEDYNAIIVKILKED